MVLKFIDTLCFSTLLALLGFFLTEILLSYWGYTPWQLRSVAVSVLGPDEHTGWAPVPGRYQKLLQDMTTVEMSINPDGTRPTALDSEQQDMKLIVLGDSVMYGFGLEDKNTFAWRLQYKLDDVQVINLAVSGYGHTQSLLRFQQYYGGKKLHKTVVLIRYSDYYIHRDIGVKWWASQLSQLSRKLNAKLPYSDLDSNGELVIHPPENYFFELPFRERFASIRIVEEAIANLGSLGRESRKREIFNQIFEKLIVEIRKTGALPVIFHGEDREGPLLLDELIDRLELTSVSCIHPYGKDPKYFLPNDPHPGPEINQFWAECLSLQLEPIFAEIAKEN